MKRVLFIRGGAIGDFILTLPAVRLVREKWPEAHIEILGYPDIAELGHKRYYFDAVQSMNRGALSGFFIPLAVLDPDLMDYVESFDLVVSYLFDPDKIFATNLLKCQPGRIRFDTPKVREGQPAALHFTKTLEILEITPQTSESYLHLTDEDTQAATTFLQANGANQDGQLPLLAIHPGSGSQAKNWPTERWQTLLEKLSLDGSHRLLVLGGEAESGRLHEVTAKVKPGTKVVYAENLPLPTVAALLQQADAFLGHDSGISHVAAAVGTPTLAMFGPTAPATWAPQGSHVQVIQKGAAMGDIESKHIHHALANLPSRRQSP